VADSHANVRASERYDLEIKVDLESEHNFYTGLTQNISAGGLFIATHHLRRIGDRIALKFQLPGSEKSGRGRDRGPLDPRELGPHAR
jgi:Tfp pilus assembly protein PilZ